MASSAMPPPAVKKRVGLDFNQYSNAPTQVSSSAHRVAFVTSGRAKRRKRFFTKELRKMMYGFGDVAAPVDDSVAVLEDLVCDFILTVVTGAMHSSKRKGGFKIEDLLFYLRSDRKKYLRIKDLVKRSEEVRDIRKTFEVDKSDLNSLDKKALAKEKEKEKRAAAAAADGDGDPAAP
mmetsp:Transcript_20060/g.52103  ORF Transcript_20060/g.52103 Transcript_20060/m.52103 type:complete len:177 (-) Transcript_20060:736-1266(-)